MSENLSFPNAVFKELSLGFRNSSQKDGCEAPYLNCQPLHPIRLLDFRPFQPTRHESRAKQPENLLQTKSSTKCWAKHLKIRQVSIGLPLNNPQKDNPTQHHQPSNLDLPEFDSHPPPMQHQDLQRASWKISLCQLLQQDLGIRSMFVYFCCLPQIFGRKKRSEEMFIYLLISSMCLRFAF